MDMLLICAVDVFKPARDNLTRSLLAVRFLRVGVLDVLI